MRKFLAVSLLVSFVAIFPASAQEEVIVTAQRRDADGYSADVPAVGLRRTADFAIQEVTITGDSRDAGTRADEIFGMLENALGAANKAGVQLAYGDATVEPVTPKNFRTLTLLKDSRPDSQRVKFLVKSALGPAQDAKAAQAKINAFVKSVKPVGRALMETSDDLTFSVVRPDQYRSAIADIIANDAKAMAARMGADYGVEIEGLNRPVEWQRSGLSEVLLYIPYKLIITPKR